MTVILLPIIAVRYDMERFASPQRNQRGAKARFLRREVQRTGFWFVDIPRTSSSSIRAELGKVFGPTHGKLNIPETEHATKQLFRDHLTALQIRRRLRESVWDGLFTFTIVRNPWDRALSLYQYFRKLNSSLDDVSFETFIQTMYQERLHPGSTLMTYRPLRYSCLDFITDGDGKIIVNKIVRFEDREKDLSEIGARLGCPELGQMKLNHARPVGTLYQEYYSKTSQLYIAEMFSDDINYFGYSFE